jgi:hypothetical protein
MEALDRLGSLVLNVANMSQCEQRRWDIRGTSPVIEVHTTQTLVSDLWLCLEHYPIRFLKAGNRIDMKAIAVHPNVEYRRNHHNA